MTGLDKDRQIISRFPPFILSFFGVKLIVGALATWAIYTQGQLLL